MDERGGRRWMGRDGVRVAMGVTSAVTIAGGAAGGCLDRPIDLVDPRTTSVNVQKLGQSSVDKIDLLLVVDNSGSMADKQAVLQLAIPQLVSRLVFPQCVDLEGTPDPGGATVADGPCPEGTKPEFQPVDDIHIGIVSSSLGSAGSSLCEPGTDDEGNALRPDVQDAGHLIWRTQQDTDANDAATWEGQGFLAWDPEGKHLCPGSDTEVCPGSDDPDELVATLTSMVAGVGEVGCGFEAPLEAAYRFLVDPAPWQTLAPGGVTSGVDETLLAQRAAFLRPDSLVAVVVLSDENDCSIRNDAIGTIVATPQGERPLMPRPRAECEADPDDPCCKSCIEPAGDCPGDGGCAAPGDQADLANYHPETVEEGEPNQQEINLRCFDQKRRFGIDFLYPTSRYVNAFSQREIDPDRLDLVVGDGGGEPNPLLTPDRQDGLVFLAGIVGVPWQLIARKDGNGAADLQAGLTTPDPEGDEAQAALGGFQTFDELTRNDAWRLLLPLPLPDGGADLPDDPHMIESPFPRPGLTTERGRDPIHGNEYTTHFADLQYACVFDLPDDFEKDCDGLGPACDCHDPTNDKPLCSATEPTRQVSAKAYPGTRILQTIQGLGAQGIPASICPLQLDQPDAKTFGYAPAVAAIVDRLKGALGGEVCQPQKLRADEEGAAQCLVIEVRDSDGDHDSATTGDCDCDIPGRREPEGGAAITAEEIRRDLADDVPSSGLDCLCEVVQLEGSADDPESDRHHCQNDLQPPSGVDGWCYVDATAVPPLGNAELVAECLPSERRVVRFVGEGALKGDGQQHITCAGDASY